MKLPSYSLINLSTDFSEKVHHNIAIFYTLLTFSCTFHAAVP